MNGDTWSTVVDSDGIGSGAFYNAVATGNNRVYVGGGHFHAASADTSWTLRHSTDGTTFVTDDTYDYTPTGDQTALAQILPLSGGTVYALGTVKPTDALVPNHLLIRYAPNASSSYVTALDVSLPTVSLFETGFTDWSSTMYALYNSGTTWANRTSTILYSVGGVTWTPITTPPNMLVTAICGSGGGLIAVGTTSLGTNGDWVTYATTDHATWTLKDTVLHTSSSYVYPQGCGFAGNYVYIVGVHHDTQASWMVRRGNDTTSLDGWTTVNYDAMDSQSNGPTSAAIDFSTGKLYVTGSLHTSASWYWRTRRATTSGGSWVDSDEFQPTSSTGGQASNAAAVAGLSPLGTFVVGTANNHGIVRRLAPQ